MSEAYDTARWAARRRPFEELEGALVRLTDPSKPEGARLDEEGRRRVDQLRYALSFGRLLAVRNPDGRDVDVAGPLDLFSRELLALLRPKIEGARDARAALQVADEAARRTARARRSLLQALPVERDALEQEVTTRQLLIASGGGGGAGYVYPGTYDMLDRIGLAPALMVGTSIGSLMSMFRARRARFDLAALVAAARRLSWTNVFEVFQSANRYGLPATLRLHLRRALGELFQLDGRAMRMSDTDIRLFVVSTGITVDALKHDLDYYEHLLDDVMDTTPTMRARSAFKVMGIAREFLQRRDALREIVFGRTPGTEHFDVLDAAGFSAAIPGVIHYDVLREDLRMRAILDELYASYGITRLGEGGMVSNVPARIAWETAIAGELGGRRNCFVLALDCFAPSLSTRAVWYPFQRLVREANVVEDMKFSDLYLPYAQTLSPLNLVPTLPDAMEAIRMGREAFRPHLSFVSEMMRELPVLDDRLAA
jgi:predicted acylesterase/phospholipase RssA